MLTIDLADANDLLLSSAGKRLCDTSLVIDEIRSQVAAKRGFWKIEGELARERLEGIIELQGTDEPQQEVTRKSAYLP